tara:strand:+ start:847 stop:1326 length:480 start_codon:yes stop_codon:yes gene_type:complete
MKYLKDINFVLNEKKLTLIFFLFLFIMVSILDIISISFVGPYLGLLLDSENFTQDKFILFIRTNVLDLDYVNFTNYFGIFLVSFFIFKAIIAIIIKKIVIEFGHNQSHKLRLKLMRIYQLTPYLKYVEKNTSEYIHNVQIVASKFGTHVIIPLLNYHKY